MSVHAHYASLTAKAVADITKVIVSARWPDLQLAHARPKPATEPTEYRASGVQTSRKDVLNSDLEQCLRQFWWNAWVQNEHEDAKMSTRRPKMSPRRPQEVKNEPWEAENEPQEARGDQK